MIRFSSVSYQHGGVDIVSDINFEMEPGAKVSISGPSGSGKSTILKLAMGILQPARGQVFVANVLLDKENLVRMRRQIAYLGQEAVMGAELVGDALLLPFSFKANRDIKPDHELVEKVLASVGLQSDIVSKHSKSISGGERQRLVLARAILLKKRIIIADEVTSALDVRNRNTINNLLLDTDWTLLAASHDQTFTESCDSVLEIEAGRLRRVR